MNRLHWYRDLEIDEVEPVRRRQLASSVIEGIEKTFGVTLPSDYKQLLAEHHGDAPIESSYRVEAPNGEMHGGFGTFLTGDPYAQENIFVSARSVTRGVIPFSVDGGGNFLCFDYRNHATRAKPVIVHWDHEVVEDENYFFVTDSFATLIDSLTIPDDVIEDLDAQGLLPNDLKR